MSKPVRIDVVSDVVCPWCFIGKKRLEQAVAMTPGIPVEVHFRPYFLNDWIPLEEMSREQYLTAKFGSPECLQGHRSARHGCRCRRRARLCERPHQSPAEHARSASPYSLGGSDRQSA